MTYDKFPMGVNHEHYASMMYIIPFLIDAHTVVETGLSEGSSTGIFLTALSNLPNPETRTLHTYEIDINKPECQRARNKIPSLGFKANWKLIEIDSIQGGKEYSSNDIDFLFLDSDHGIEHLYKELNAWVPHISSSCIIASDDTWLKNQTADLALLGMRKWLVENKNWKEFTFMEPVGMTVLYR